MSSSGSTVQARKEGQHTAVSLVADVRSIQPGAHFTVGLLMRMSPGWHTYWQNPGETGLPTEIRWKLPEGFTAGAIEWPLPEKQIERGDVLTYGYAGETMLLIPFSAPSALPPGLPVKIAASVSWLECKNSCVPGKASLSLTLPAAAAQPAPDNVSLFARFRALVPARYAGPIRVTLDAGSGVVGLRLRIPQDMIPPSATVDFFPMEFPGAPSGRASAALQGDVVTVTIPLTVQPPIDSARSLHGVLVVKAPRDKSATGSPVRSSSDIRITLSPGTMASLSAPRAAEQKGGLLDRQFTIATEGNRQPLILYLAFAFIGGLLLNIMPCVLPVVALKIFGLVKMAGDTPARIKKLGWSFSAGILSSFLLLALIVILLQAAGQQVGWGFQFQEPLFVIAMCAVVFAFGLSLFGVFEIRLPAKAMEGVGTVLQKQEGGSGYAASFSEGVFATILATPCTAPFLGTALGFAFSQPPWAILVIFAVVAAGMAIPYVLLTANPAWVRFLPKPGAWMETAKQIMGFLMMATLLWLLYVLGKEIGVEGIVWTGAFLLTIGLACWMIGRFLTLSATRIRALVIWAIALVLNAGAYMLFISPLLQASDSVNASAPGSATEAGGLVWESFSPEKLEAHFRDNRTVLLDFTAEWCLTCKVNEKTVLSDPDVVNKIKASGIVTVRADWTSRNPDITRLLSKFGRSGVPLYVLFPAGRPSEPIVLPEVITGSLLMGAVDSATAKGG